MRIAIPMADGALCMHFGHCSTFALVDVEEGRITSMEEVVPPPHQPGLLPPWLAQQNVTVVIAGGMGARAQELFRNSGVNVITGASGQGAADIAQSFIEGTLSTGVNACDH